MAPDRALEFACAIGAGVGAAHRQNIVHRDLKPLNIMTQTGQPVSEGLKILDFGLAKIKSGELLGSFVQAKTSGMMGSPFYMAPEQWSDDEPDARADIYSLGIILYQMLAGDVPFKGASIPSIMKKHLTLPPPTFKSAGIDVSPRLEAVVRHALEKEPSARTPSVEVFVKELRDAVAAGGSTARPTLPVSDETMYAPASNTAVQQHTTGDSRLELDGTVSTSALSEEEQAKLAAAREAHEREQKEKERVAREELDREAEERRRSEEDKQRTVKEQEERILKEKQEREDRERQQREQMERVERQAKELEERLARLATSMPPPPATAVVDLEATQVHQGVRTETIGNNSFPGGASAIQTGDSVPPARLSVSIPPPKPKNNSLMMIGAAVVVVVLIGGAIGAYLLWKSKTTPPGGPGASPTPAASPGHEAIKADLVEIPGGTFQMGRNDGPFQERPVHSVTVPKFFMDRTEVTNAEYALFVQEMNYEAPADWAKGKPLLGQELWPVANVSAVDAQAFAAWRSKRDGVTYRLPTEEEWEFAARNGGEFRAFPWGAAWQEKRAVVKGASPKPVGSLPDGKNRWGVVDLIGNVSEWTSSKASIYDGRQIPPENRDWLVLRGGSYASDPDDPQIPISATYRDWFKPTLRHPTFGFRLVRSGQ
jgi:formylglycine-generating enzyme required for sulfatase activity